MILGIAFLTGVRAFSRGPYLSDVELDFSWPGKPIVRAMIEAFYARLRMNASTKGGSCLWRMLGGK